jgi:hypothetical protein
LLRAEVVGAAMVPAADLRKALRFTAPSPNLMRYGGNPSSKVRAACRSAVAKPSVNRS